MKLVKLGVFALALGVFASCNNEETTSTETKTDSAAMVAPAPMETAPVTTTSTDTAVLAPNAGDSMTIKSETTTEVKH
jgi:hypothetical protein